MPHEVLTVKNEDQHVKYGWLYTFGTKCDSVPKVWLYTKQSKMNLVTPNKYDHDITEKGSHKHEEKIVMIKYFMQWLCQLLYTVTLTVDKSVLTITEFLIYLNELIIIKNHCKYTIEAFIVMANPYTDSSKSGKISK